MILHSSDQFLVEPKILIGKKFKECFPKIKRRPYDFKLAVESYDNAVKRLEDDSYKAKGKKTKDINLVNKAKERMPYYIYISKFVLDGTGTIKGYNY